MSCVVLLFHHLPASFSALTGSGMGLGIKIGDNGNILYDHTYCISYTENYKCLN